MMGLETATYVSQLIPTNPVVGDPVSQGDDHFRLLKSVLQNTFPNASKAFYFPTSIAEASSTVNVVAGDNGKVIPVDASTPRTVNLPNTPADGFEVTIVKSDDVEESAVTITPASGEINGEASITLLYPWESARCIYLSTFGAWLALRSPKLSPFDFGGVAEIVWPIANGGTGQDTAYEAFDALNPARVDVASSATIDLDAAQSSYVRITGTTTITAVTLTAGRKRWVVFAGALTFTNGASLILPTAANITTVAGDTALLVGEAAGVVRCVFYHRASGLTTLVRYIPRRNYAEYTSNADLEDIPFDDTIPQVGEGTEVLSATLTPQTATHRVRIRFSAFFGMTAGTAFTAALFIDGAANAVQAASGCVVDNSACGHISLEYEYVPGDTSEHTYSIRCGGEAGSTSRLNGLFNARRYGGAAKATIVVEEIVL